jgi:GNAT superfamily N-acetyltransferase
VELIAKQLREGTQPCYLLPGPNDEPLGLVLDRITPLGHRVGLFLAPEFRSPASSRSALTTLCSSPELRPLVGLRFLARAPPTDSIAAQMESLGLRFLGRIDLEFPLDAPLPSFAAGGELSLRPVVREDSAALARLMHAAYSTDPYDVAIFLEDPDAAEDARRSVEDILSARYGAWIGAASFVHEREGELRGAILAVENDGGLIAELLVDPRSRRLGLGKLLLTSAIRELREGGHLPVRLVFTQPNRPAERLYLSLGFRPPVPAIAGGEWVDVARVGHPEIADELRLVTGQGETERSAALGRLP